MDFLYQNIGEKIKSMAKAMFFVEAVASIILGLIIIGEEVFVWNATFGVITLIAGPIIAWVSSLITYGFGELVEKVVSIDKKTKRDVHSNFEAEQSTIKNHSQNFTKVQQEEYEIDYNPNADEIISQTQSIVDSNNTLSNAQKKKYNKSVSLLNAQLKLDIITEEEYQKQCAEIRSKL